MDERASSPPRTDFGQCPCGGIYEQRSVDIRMTRSAEELTLPAVRQGVCPVCGGRVWKADVIEELEAAMRGRTVPVSR